MAEKKLSPRQRMINMMYLVLTALLALNVSKEVLNSFFEVNTGIERTTTNFTTKNNEVYTAFDNAVFNNPEKFKSVRDDAYSIKNKADDLVETIQEMKYSLVLDVDGGVYLGNESLDKEGKPIKDKRIELSYSELSSVQKSKPIAYLYNKKNRTASGELLIKTNRALDLKNSINDYRDLLIGFSVGNPVIQSNLETTLNTEDRKTGKKGLKVKSWEEYNFDDMPSVGAVTLLSKMQSDIRNTEADVIKLLKESIDVGSLKFTSAEAIQIPNSSFVLRGDSFKADIFISAKDTTQDPVIYVGEYDSLGNGQYQMKGEYETVRVINGKGLYAKKVVKEGAHEWGGLISMKTETGTKMFPFNGTYLGANKTAVISPVNMNILYQQVDNPLKISVPGFAATDVTPMINNGSISATKKSSGEYTAKPTKTGKAIVSLYAKLNGKRTKMGEMEFRVKEVPPPKPYVLFTSQDGKFINKNKMVAAGGILAKLEDFDFKGIRYNITEFKMSGIYQGEQQTAETKGMKFTSKMEGIIKNTKSGNTITIYDIKARRTDAKNTKEHTLYPLVLQIK